MARLAPVALALAGLLAVGCGDDPSPGEERADQVREAAAGAGLDDEVADLLADAAAGIDGTYRITYALEDRTVVVTQRPPDRRIDTTTADGGTDAVITVDGTTHACSDPPGEPETWSCEELGRPPADGAFDPADVDELVDALVTSADRFALSVDERVVAGTDARCLVATPTDPPGGASSSLCIAPTGAILLVERPAGTLRATAHESDVDDGAFVLPA